MCTLLISHGNPAKGYIILEKINSRGIVRSHIFFKCKTNNECETGKWYLQSLIKPEFILELSNDYLPMGRQKWNLAQGKTFCKYEIGNFIDLTISQCYPGKFTCDSGQCIQLEERCNIELNCEDKTDEYNCDKITTGNGYAKEQVPVSVTSEPTIIYIKPISAYLYLNNIRKTYESLHETYTYLYIYI